MMSNVFRKHHYLNSPKVPYKDKIENVIRYGIVKKIISNRSLKEDLDPGVLR